MNTNQLFLGSIWNKKSEDKCCSNCPTLSTDIGNILECRTNGLFADGGNSSVTSTLSRSMFDSPLVKDHVTGELKYRNQLVSLTTGRKYLQSFSLQNTPLNSIWANLTWSPDLKLLVATSHSAANSTGIMTSPDGIVWTTRTTPQREWRGVAWSPKLQLFAAVAGTGPNGVMTSPDGVTWAQGVLPNSYLYRYLIWVDELELFIAVANTTGVTDKVLTSPDGINWTVRTCPDGRWNQVVWAADKGLLVASSGTTGAVCPVMTSPDGINWTAINHPEIDGGNWEGICYSPDLGLFVMNEFVFGGAGVVGKRIATSTDAINWTRRTTPAEGQWLSTAWSPQMGMFLCVGDDLVSFNQAMTSNDGITWELVVPAAYKAWRRVLWVKELGAFVSVAFYDGTTPADNLIQLTRAEDDKQQYLSIYNRLTPQTVQGETRFTTNLYAGQRLIEGTNENFFASATLRSYTEYSTSSNLTKTGNFVASQYLFLNNGANLTGAQNVYLNQAFRIRGASTIAGSGNEVRAVSIDNLFSRALDFTNTPSITGSTDPFFPFTALGVRMGITNAGAISATGWYSSIFCHYQARNDAHNMENYADIILGGFQVFSGGTATNKYGLYINPIKQTWVTGRAIGIYQAGTDDANYFAGKSLFGGAYTAPTAYISLGAGTTTSAPLKLTAGTNRTTPENGSFEFDGTNLYFTVGGVRKTVTLV